MHWKMDWKKWKNTLLRIDCLLTALLIAAAAYCGHWAWKLYRLPDVEEINSQIQAAREQIPGLETSVAEARQQMEQAEAGAGLARYEQNLTTQEAGFLAFTEAAGLESPFAEGRVASVRKTMEEVLK